MFSKSLFNVILFILTVCSQRSSCTAVSTYTAYVIKNLASVPELMAFADLAEEFGRYDDMIEAMERVVPMLEGKLNSVQRKVLFFAFKNSIESREASWKLLSEINKTHAKTANKFKEAIGKEILEISNEILGLLQSHLISRASTSEEMVFYQTMTGDCYRYIVEYSASESNERNIKNAIDAYKEATEVADEDLRPSDPIRLRLALKLSAFHYEILKKPDQAITLAKTAFDNAIVDLDDESSKETTSILESLHDKLTLWRSDHDKEE